MYKFLYLIANIINDIKAVVAQREKGCLSSIER